MTTLTSQITIGEPDVAGALAVFPLFGPEPALEYLSYAEAATHGARVTEMPHAAVVNDLLVHNPLPVPVLLYEGEELVGAQQDRTVDAAVLVPAASDLEVAVSCVERGRWDGRRHAEAFEPSARAAFPGLRAAKNERMRERLAAGEPARADQAEVWEAVDALACESPTRAMGAAYGRDGLDELRGAIRRRDGQCGTLVAIGGAFVVLDYVSRADVFAALHGPLVAGYALDAIDAKRHPAPQEPEALLEQVLAAPKRLSPSAGLGRQLHFQHGRLAGTGLVHDDEIVQLSAFVRS